MQGGEQAAILDHVGEGFAGRDLAREGQEGRPHHVFELGIRDHHVEDGLGVRNDLVPHPEGREQAAGGGRDRRGAGIGDRAVQRRIGDHHREGVTEPLAQRDRQSEAGKAAAGDHHVGTRGNIFAS